MTKTIAKDIAQNINTQKFLFHTLLTGSILLFIVYIYLISSITFNVVARKSLENNLIALNNQVNELDLSYLDKINKIDKEYAQSKGFVDSHQNIFVSRNINHVAIR